MTWWPGWRRGRTTTSPSPSWPRSWPPGSAPCYGGPGPPRKTPRALTFGDLQLLPEQGVLRHLNGEEVHCTRTEFRLLCELAASPNKVLSREQLLDRVWGYDYFGDGRLVDVHIRRLRTKVEVDPRCPSTY